MKRSGRGGEERGRGADEMTGKQKGRESKHRQFRNHTFPSQFHISFMFKKLWAKY